MGTITETKGIADLEPIKARMLKTQRARKIRYIVDALEAGIFKPEVILHAMYTKPDK